MIYMRRFALRTQFAVIVAFLIVFSLGAGLSGWIRSEAQTYSHAHLQRDLAVATKLPRLKSLLRNLDLVTAQYLRTGKKEWLIEHKEVLDKIDKTQTDLAQLLPESREKKILEELDRQIKDHFIQESRWIRARRAGQLTPEHIAQIISARRNYEDILEIALNMQDINIQEFPGRIQAADRASRYGALLVFLVGLAASAVLARALSRYVIEPVRSLEKYAREWKPGQPWTCDAPLVSPEINSLFQQMRSLMENINQEYLKEKDVGRLKSQLVSTVSHELNNAISVIHAASINLEETDPEPRNEKREKMYRMIKRQTRALSTEISNLLNNARLESGRLSLDRKKTEIGALLRESLELMEILYENKNLHATLSLPDIPITLDADPDALRLVLTNLLSNAIKYTPEGGSISAGIEREGRNGEFVRVYVKDTGIGIKPEERKKIFSGFYRTEGGQKLAKGFGIGLSLAQSILEAHWTKLELESEPGKGSTFSFLLPVWIPGRDGKEEEKKPAPAPVRESMRVGTAV